MKFSSTQLVGIIASDYKESIPLFEKHGINYYSEGDRTLWVACSSAGVPVQTVLDELDGLLIDGGEAIVSKPVLNFQTTADLSDYIVKTHHEYTREQLRLIGRLVNSGANRGLPSLQRTEEVFLKLSDDFWRHMQWEEQVVFPYLIKADLAFQAGTPTSPLFKESHFAENPLRKLLEEHHMMEREFGELSELVGDLPDDDPFRCALDDLAADNRRHLHLENQVLMKRAMQQGLL